MNKVKIEEGDASLEAMCHAHAVGTLEVDVLEVRKDSATLALQRCCIGTVAKVEIACGAMNAVPKV